MNFTGFFPENKFRVPRAKTYRPHDNESSLLYSISSLKPNTYDDLTGFVAVAGASRVVLGQKSHFAYGKMSVFSRDVKHGSAAVTTSFLLGSLRLSPREK